MICRQAENYDSKPARQSLQRGKPPFGFALRVRQFTLVGKPAYVLSIVLRKSVAFLNAEGRRGNAEGRRVFINIIRYELMKRCTKRTRYANFKRSHQSPRLGNPPESAGLTATRCLPYHSLGYDLITKENYIVRRVTKQE